MRKDKYMFNKRGVSPLIATVLLIAFAVSLGAVLINLGLNLFGDPCKDRSIDILVLDGSPRVCHVLSTKTLSMTLVNNGKKTVDGFKLSILGDKTYNEDVPESLKTAEKKVISYPVSDLTKIDIVTIVPYYEKSGQPQYCTKNQKDYVKIPDC